MRASPRVAWAFPASYAAHLIEEYVAGGGFTRWAHESLGVAMSSREFVLWNAAGLILVVAGAALASRGGRYSWIELSLATAVLGNAVAHMVAAVVTLTYSPGLVTGTLVWLPLGAWRGRAAFNACGERGRRMGLLLGAIAAILPPVVML